MSQKKYLLRSGGSFRNELNYNNFLLKSLKSWYNLLKYKNVRSDLMFEGLVYSIGRVMDGTYSALGTCTLIHTGNQTSLLVTAAHVANGNDENLFIRPNDNFVGGYQDTTVNHFTVHGVKIVAIDPLRDVCILTFKDRVLSNSNVYLSNCENINLGEKVNVVGFPHSNLGRIVLTQQSCEVGAKILLSSNIIKSKHLVLNIQARPGQSGGPIFQISEDGRINLIAILLGAYAPTIKAGIRLGDIDPQTLHQTTHAVSAEYLERML
ncbi:S1 family peptidase [Priestia megaterium]|uniref:S1 family peptidase n=1 Tax=Priestia megaterium TaxID=1404 RepID=UPI001FB3D30F|nr:serine protease [Priestia megaterium]